MLTYYHNAARKKNFFYSGSRRTIKKGKNVKYLWKYLFQKPLVVDQNERSNISPYVQFQRKMMFFL